MSLTQINSAGIADGAIVNADINSSADIALSKLDTSGTASSSNYLRGDGAWSAIDLSTKLNLTGGTITGDLTVETTAGGDFLFDNSDNALLVGDNTSIKFGAGTDFRLSSDGTNDGGALLSAGDFRIASSGSSKAINIMKGTSAYLGRFITDGAVELYHNGTKKAETVSGGFTISGTCTATSFAGDGSNLSGVAAFPSGTKMIFQQTSAPTGWTKVTSSVDNRALRVVSGSASSGGSAAFTSAFSSQSVSGSVANTTAGGSISTNNTTQGGSVNSHTLSTSQIPSHRHTGGIKGIWDLKDGYYGTISNVGNTDYPAARYTNGYANYDLYYTSYTGSTNSHNHGFSGSSHNHSGSFSGSAHNHSFSGSAIDLAVQYIDVIIASKD